jgi:hypothetical protein
MKWITLISLLALASPANAHDHWSNGDKVPDWVKASCCGAKDMHHLTPDMVHRVSDDWYMVDGYEGKILAKAALPSQDGDYWVFYACSSPMCSVYCFFVPMAF